MSIPSLDTLKLVVSPVRTEALFHRSALPESYRRNLCRDIAYNKWMIIGTLAIIALSLFVTCLSRSDSIHQPVNIRCRAAACTALLFNLRRLFSQLEFVKKLTDV